MSGRIRSIKPEWLEDELSLCSSDARVLSVALLLLADDHGNGRAHPNQLASQVFPGDLAKCLETLAKAREELERLRFALFYELDGQRYFHIRNWEKHQKVDKPGKPRVPGPPQDCSGTFPVAKPIESLEKVPETLATDQDHDLDLDQRPVPGPRERTHRRSNSDSGKTLAERSQDVLDNPHDGRYSRPSKWPEVVEAAEALAPGKDLRLRDDPGKDPDLRAILDALAAGYTVADLRRASVAAQSDAWFKTLDRPTPCAFSPVVLRRLLAEKPPGQVAHEAATGKSGAGGRKWTETGRDSSGKPCAWTDENGRTTYKNPFQEAS